MLSAKNISRNKVQIISRAVERLEEENECFGFPHEKVISDPWSGGAESTLEWIVKEANTLVTFKKKKKDVIVQFLILTTSDSLQNHAIFES